MTRREAIELGIAALLVAAAAACHYGGAPSVATFLVSAVALAMLARLVGTATEQLGARLGSGAAGVVQSALGNLPELFIALFALHAGLIGVVQSALVGSVLANSVLVLGLAFAVGGLRNGTQRFDSDRARMISTLTLLAAATMTIPTLAHAFHTPAAPHTQALSLICAGVLLALFLLTLPSFIRSPGNEELEPPRWTPLLTAVLLGAAGLAAAFASDWFVTALTPAIVFASLLFAAHLTLVFPTLLALVLLISSILGAVIVNDGQSTWQEGAVLIGFYVVIAASFWWGT